MFSISGADPNTGLFGMVIVSDQYRFGDVLCFIGYVRLTMCRSHSDGSPVDVATEIPLVFALFDENVR